ncbi:MAG TPA: hypothetical protein VGO46_08635 [Gemmatimonadaceae bacterium]|nr:hypothetical protein [Gemmatimonadaceae bacterium]
MTIRRWVADFIYPEGKRVRASPITDRTELQERARSAFHMLWSNAVGTPDYKKSDWKEFGEILNALDVTL